MLRGTLICLKPKLKSKLNSNTHTQTQTHTHTLTTPHTHTLSLSLSLSLSKAQAAAMDLKRQILGQFENVTFPGPEENPDMFGIMPEEVLFI
jgi:hypothetical protein